MTEQVWDKGLQPERTALSWRRLSLVFLGVALFLPRAFWPLAGPWSLVGSGLLAVLAFVIFASAERRYRATRLALSGAGGRTLPDGRLLMLSALGGIALGFASLVLIVGR